MRDVGKAVEDLSPPGRPFKVLVYLTFKGASQPREVSEGMGLSPGAVRPALRLLQGKGYVIRLEDGSYRSNVPFTDIISDLYAIGGGHSRQP